jgi:hypothetical protein
MASFEPFQGITSEGRIGFMSYLTHYSPTIIEAVTALCKEGTDYGYAYSISISVTL